MPSCALKKKTSMQNPGCRPGYRPTPGLANNRCSLVNHAVPAPVMYQLADPSLINRTNMYCALSAYVAAPSILSEPLAVNVTVPIPLSTCFATSSNPAGTDTANGRVRVQPTAPAVTRSVSSLDAAV